MGHNAKSRAVARLRLNQLRQQRHRLPRGLVEMSHPEAASLAAQFEMGFEDSKLKVTIV